MNQLESFRTIKAFIFDIDGVLTNGEVLVTETGELLRRMSIRDGYALRRAVEEDFIIGIISGGKSQGVKIRLHGLGIPEENIFLGIKDKLEVYEKFVAQHDLKTNEILYMGDDVPDLEVMRKAGLPACPVDAAPEILNEARYVSVLKGGQGCARDVIEKVMRLQGSWLQYEEEEFHFDPEE